MIRRGSSVVHNDKDSFEKSRVNDVDIENGQYDFRSTPEDEVESDTSLEREPSLLAKCVAEVVGTAILLIFGTGVVAQAVLAGQSNSTAIHLTWGLAVTFGVLISHRISGAHLNPAVTLGFASVGGFPLKHVLPYWLSQLVGAFLGAAWTYFSYYNSFNNETTTTPEYPFGKSLSTNIFCTSPGPNMTTAGAFADEVLATCLLMMGIMAIVDAKQKYQANIWHVAGFVGLLVVAIGMAFGANTGYAINPARDFGPRLFMSMSGWGTQVFTYSNYYFLVPLFAPFVGALMGAQIMRLSVLRL